MYLGSRTRRTYSYSDQEQALDRAAGWACSRQAFAICTATGEHTGTHRPDPGQRCFQAQHGHPVMQNRHLQRSTWISHSHRDSCRLLSFSHNPRQDSSTEWRRKSCTMHVMMETAFGTPKESGLLKPSSTFWRSQAAARSAAQEGRDKATKKP